MLLSALLTSVGINLVLTLLFLALYSVLRKQPGNITVYAPRLVHEGLSLRRDGFNLERLLPSPGWIKKALEPSDEELLSTVGLDALVFTRIFKFSLKVFSFAGIVGICLLLPVNYLGTQLERFSDLPKKSLDSFSISNVDNGSNRLWIHFCATYIFTGFVCYLLYIEYCYISSKRLAHFQLSKPQPHQFTILVTSIPNAPGSSISETVESFFGKYHPSTYLSHVVVRRTGKLHGLINNVKKLYKKLARLKTDNRSRQRFKRDGFLGLFGRKVSLIDDCENKLEGLEDSVRMNRSLLMGQEVAAAFVSFKSRYGAAIAMHIQQGPDPTKWIAESAPEPQDIHWLFAPTYFIKRWIIKVVVVAAFITLIILFFVPVLLVQSLANLNQLETWFPFLKRVLHMTLVSQLITGYLPSLILQLFLYIVPPVMILLSSMQGYISNSEIERSACSKLLFFTIWNSFFATVLSGSALYRVNVFLEPKKIPEVLAAAVPGQACICESCIYTLMNKKTTTGVKASFFISYVLTSGWTDVSSEILRLVPFLLCFFKKLFGREDDNELDVPSTPYHGEIPRVLFFGLLGITYFFLAPLMLPFLLVYFGLGFIIYRNQLLNVYMANYETGGQFWPIMHNSTIFSLVLMHVIAIGLFGLKKLPLASGLTLPLPVLTLLFNAYCRKRFLPVFRAYPTQSLVDKDREDEKDPNMSDFYDKLATAYQDPALTHSDFSGGDNSRSTPLLRAANV